MILSTKERNEVFEYIGYIEGRVYALGDGDNGALLLDSVLMLKDLLHKTFAGDEPKVEAVAHKVPASDHKVTPITALSLPENTLEKEEAASESSDKHTRYREKCRAEGRCPHCGKPCAPYAECEERRRQKLQTAHGQEEYKRPEDHGQRAPRTNSPLHGKLQEIQEHLATESFGVVGHRYGVSGETIKNFLKRNGVDIMQYRKMGGNPKLIRKVAGSKAADELPHAAPETAQGEANAPIPAMGHAAVDENSSLTREEYCWKPEDKKRLLEMKAAGRGWTEIAEVLGKTVSQCRSIYHMERKKAEREAKGVEPLKPPGGERWNPKLTPEMLPGILVELETRSFADCGSIHGVTGHAVIDFLKRNGVSQEQFKKQPGRGVKSSSGEDDGWPEPVRPERTLREAVRTESCPRAEAVASLLAAMPQVNDRENSRLKRHDVERILKFLENQPMSVVAERLGESANTVDNFLKRCGIDYRTLPPKTPKPAPAENTAPLMKFKTVKVGPRYGTPAFEMQVPEPSGEYKDPETGAKVTTYPAGYAMGTHPTRNVSVKGGG